MVQDMRPSLPGGSSTTTEVMLPTISPPHAHSSFPRSYPTHFHLQSGAEQALCTVGVSMHDIHTHMRETEMRNRQYMPDVNYIKVRRLFLCSCVPVFPRVPSL